MTPRSLQSRRNSVHGTSNCLHWFFTVVAIGAFVAPSRSDAIAPISTIVQAIQSSLIGDCENFPDCRKLADLKDDPADPKGKKKCKDKGKVKQSNGIALHMAYATGAVWTEVPVLTTYGEGEEALNIMLSYNTLHADTDSGYGKGWSLDIGGDQGSFPASYTEFPAETQINPEFPEDCSCQCGASGNAGGCFGPSCSGCQPALNLGDPENTAPCASYHCPNGWEPILILRVPGRVVVYDSDGRHNAYYRYTEGYGSISPPLPYHDEDFRHRSPLYSPPNRDALLYDYFQTAPQSDIKFRLETVDGTKFYFNQESEDAFGYRSGRLVKVEHPRGSATVLDYGHTNKKRPTRLTDRFGHIVDLVWNSSGSQLDAIVQHGDAGQLHTTSLNYSNTAYGNRLASVQDPHGDVTSFGYDTLNRITQETTKNNRVFTCTYDDTDSNLTTYSPEGQGAWQARTIWAWNPVTSSADRVLTLAVARRTAESFPLLRNSRTADDTIKYRNGNGEVWQLHRNLWGMIDEDRFPAGSSGSPFTYKKTANYEDSNPPAADGTLGRLLYFKDHTAGCFTPGLSGCATQSTLEEIYTWQPVTSGQVNSRLTQLTTKLGATELNTQLLYTPDAGDSPPPYPDLPTHKILPNGAYWKYLYNSHGDVTDIIGPTNDSNLSATTHYVYTYNENGNYSSVTRTNRRGFATIYTFENPGEMTQEVTEVGPGQSITRAFTYNYQGQRLTETVDRGDGTSITTKFEYDLMGRMIATTENYVAGAPANDTTNMKVRYSYDGGGLLLSTTNPKGIKTSYEYDHRNWLITEVVDAGLGTENLNRVTNYERDANGNVKKLTKVIPGGQNQVTEYWYDEANNVVKELDAEGYHTTYQRDGGGNAFLTRRQRQTNDQSIFTPGNSSTLVSATGYDGLGRLISYQAGGVGLEALYRREYDYNDWSTPGGSGCSCSGLGTGVVRKISSTVPGEPQLVFHEVDALGRIVKKIQKNDGQNPQDDGNDSVTTYVYDDEGNLEEIHGPSGEFTKMEYDGADRMTKRTVRMGTSQSAQDLVTEYNYNGANRVTSVILPTMKELAYEYDPADRLKKVLDGEAALAQFAYDANGNQIWRTDGAGNIWETVYDRLDRPSIIKDPLKEEPIDGVTVYEYDAAGNLASQKNANGVYTCFFYDKLHRLRCTIEDCNLLTLGTGEGRGVLDGGAEGGIQAEDPLGGGGSEVSTGNVNTWTCNIYDGRFLVGLEDHDYNVTQYDYDQAGRVIDVFYPGHVAVTSPDHVHYTYALQQIARIDQRGVHTTYYFDTLGRLAHRQYDVESTFSLRHEYFSYDKTGRLESADRLGDFSWSRDYDAAGRPSLETQFFDGANAHVIGIGHNLDTTAKSLTQTLCYPPSGNCAPPNSRTVTRTYDSRLRLAKVDSGSALYESWDLDEANRRTGTDRANGVGDQYIYDVNSRLTKIAWMKVPSGGSGSQEVASQTYGYDAIGNRKYTRMASTTSLPVSLSDRSQLFGYDNRNRLTIAERGTLNTAGDNVNPWIIHPTLMGKQQWTDLDRRGNWLDYRERLQTASGMQNIYNKKRITTANGVNEYTCMATQLGPFDITPCPAQSADDSPEYDDAGNMTYNPLGCLVTDSTCWPSSGLSSTNTGGCPTGHDYAYDEENRVMGICADSNNATNPDQDGNGMPDELDANFDGVPDGMLCQFKYDALGRRVMTIEFVDPQTGAAYLDEYDQPAPRLTRHVYHGLEVVQEYTCIGDPYYFECTGTWTLAREFVWGDSNRFPEPIAMVDYTGANGVSGTGPWTYHFLRDVLGSVVGLTDSTGNLVERYTYDPYGKTYIEKWDGSVWTATNASSVGNPWMWTGQRYDAAAGTYHFHFRTYSPTMGRWLQRDPAGYVIGPNLNEYLASAPLFWTDPLGLDPAVIVLGDPGGGSDELANELAEDDPNTILILNGNEKHLEALLANPKVTKVTIISHGTGLTGPKWKRGSINSIGRKWRCSQSVDAGAMLLFGEDGYVNPDKVRRMTKNKNLKEVDLYACFQGTCNRRRQWQSAFGPTVSLKAYAGEVRPWLRWLFE